MVQNSWFDRYSLFCTDSGKVRPLLGCSEWGREWRGDGVLKWKNLIWERCIQTDDGNSSVPSIPSRTSVSNLGSGISVRRFQPLSTIPIQREETELGVNPNLRE